MADHLSTYLNDHLAGAGFALELIDHLSEEAPGLAPAAAKLRAEISEDREQLRTVMTRLNILESRVRKAGSWLAEQAAEVKLGVDDEDNGPLRRLERLEALALGIEGKIALWRALATIPNGVALSSIDLETLTHRGEEQRAKVELWRLQAASDALTI